MFSLAAGLATLNEIKRKPVIETINSTGNKIVKSLTESAQNHELDVSVSGHGFDFTLSFNYNAVSQKLMTLFIQEMIERGIYTNGVFYPCFTHKPKDIEKILLAADQVFAVISRVSKKQDRPIVKMSGPSNRFSQACITILD